MNLRAQKETVHQVYLVSTVVVLNCVQKVYQTAKGIASIFALTKTIVANVERFVPKASLVQRANANSHVQKHKPVVKGPVSMSR